MLRMHADIPVVIKVLSVANSYHYNENSKMAEIVHRQMPAPRELPQQISAPRTKAEMQKPQGGGKFLVQISRGARGMVMDEIYTCIIPYKLHWFASNVIIVIQYRTLSNV